MGNDTEQLEEELVQLASNINAAMYQLLEKIRLFDASEAWAAQGATSCAAWLNWRLGYDLRTAHEKLRVAKGLAELPLLTEGLATGALCFSKVRAATRVATPANEETLVMYADHSTASQLEK